MLLLMSGYSPPRFDAAPGDILVTPEIRLAGCVDEPPVSTAKPLPLIAPPGGDYL